MEKVSLKVSGMSCAHCEKAVTNALTKLGVASVQADAKNDLVEVEFDSSKLTIDAIKAEIIEAGYTPL